MITVIEVVIVEDHSDRKALDNECRKFFAVTTPLFLCVLLDELIEDVLPYKTKSLLLKVLWLRPQRDATASAF